MVAGRSLADRGSGVPAVTELTQFGYEKSNEVGVNEGDRLVMSIHGLSCNDERCIKPEDPSVGGPTNPSKASDNWN